MPVVPWLTVSIVVPVRGSKGIGGARGRISTPRAVPPLCSMPRVLDRSAGVWSSIAEIVGASCRTVASRSRVRTMARVYRGGAIVSIASPVRISMMACIAEFVGRPSAVAAAVAVEVRMRNRAATSGSCTPPAGAVRSHPANETGQSIGSSGVFQDLVFDRWGSGQRASTEDAHGRRPRADRLAKSAARLILSSRSAKRHGAHRRYHRSHFRHGQPALDQEVSWPRCAVAVLALRALSGAPPRTELRESTTADEACCA